MPARLSIREDERITKWGVAGADFRNMLEAIRSMMDDDVPQGIHVTTVSWQHEANLANFGYCRPVVTSGIVLDGIDGLKSKSQGWFSLHFLLCSLARDVGGSAQCRWQGPVLRINSFRLGPQGLELWT